MGSIQQSILGVFCIVAAFVLGQYMRNHPSPRSLELERQQQASVAPAPAFAIRTSSPVAKPIASQSSPRLPAPSAGFAATAPTFANQADLLATQVQKIVPVETPVQVERTIDVPDFSKLAASFENTPLALPRNSYSAFKPAPAEPRKIATHQGSFYIRPAAEPQPLKVPAPASPSVAPQDALVRNSFIGSQPERMAPPEPTEIYQVRERPTSFRKEDFQPSLITDRSKRRAPTLAAEVDRTHFREPQPQSRRQRISLAPPEPDGTYLAPEVPELVVTIPEAPEATRVEPTPAPVDRASENQYASFNSNHARNELHSYYDVDMTEPSRSVLSRQDFQSSEPVASTAPVAQRTNRRIPFGLNDQGRQELTRIRNRQQSNIDLQTNRFSQHTTQTGDTLQSLSTEYYGKPDFYLDIYLANQQILRNPAFIPAGIQLRIPKYEQ